METTTQDAGVEARQNEVALAAARDEAVKAERLRANTIRGMATGPFKVEESFLAALIDEGVSVDAARARIMTKLDAEYRKHPSDPTNPGPTIGGKDEADKRREGMEAALLLRGNPRASREMVEKGREFAGLTLVEVKSESSQGSHSAPFPRALVEFFVLAFSDKGDVIFDPFMGSGTTMAAAEVLGRAGYGCEISPAYCDVILRRTANLAGVSPVLSATGEPFAAVAKARGVDVAQALNPKAQDSGAIKHHGPNPHYGPRKRKAS